MGALLERVRAEHRVLGPRRLSIGAVAQQLGTTPRMLRYRETLGLITGTRRGSGQRQYGQPELLAAAYAVALEDRYAVTPGELSFGLQVLTDPETAADVRALGELLHRIAPTPIEALDFEAAKGRRLLGERGR